jgi:CheY-like chemotaxis protein
MVYNLPNICEVSSNVYDFRCQSHNNVCILSVMATKIAIIEDDQAISQMYRIKFEAEGYEVETAENGKLGLELADKMRPDIILLDLMMPEMNGDEALQKIRATPWGKDIKVIILTNMGEQEAPEVLKTLNVRRFIVKAEMTPRQVAEMVKTELAA